MAVKGEKKMHTHVPALQQFLYPFKYQ